MSNSAYTQLWTEQFDEQKLLAYDQKFSRRWEKNIKHREQIAFISKYLESWMSWCDCPIGSGRLMRELKSARMVGYDISDAFLEHNRRFGVECFKGDIFDFGERFPETFDLVTSLHSIFAFKDYQEILKGFVTSLKRAGILIVDLTNKEHATRWAHVKSLVLKDPAEYPDGMTRDEIVPFFDKLGCDVLEIQAHDYWDNYGFILWRFYSGNWLTRRLRKYFWMVLNFLYFKLNLFGFFHRLEQGKPDSMFTKYLVAVQKR